MDCYAEIEGKNRLIVGLCQDILKKDEIIRKLESDYLLLKVEVNDLYHKNDYLKDKIDNLKKQLKKEDENI